MIDVGTRALIDIEDYKIKVRELEDKLAYISRDRDALKAEVTKLILRIKELEEINESKIRAVQVAGENQNLSAPASSEADA